MNIDEYRALKAQDEVPPTDSAEQPVVTQPVVETPIVEATPIVEGAPTDVTDTATQPTIPETIEIDGKQVPIDELKGGYLRQSDYTRKTQDLAREREKAKVAQQYFDVINAKPDVAKQFAQAFNLPYVDPEKEKVTELEHKYQDLLLEREIELLSVKYPDFDSKEVLQLAHDEQINKLENAYLLSKARKGSGPASDLTSLREQIRQEIQQELQSNVDTGSIIGTGGSGKPVTPTTPTLSEAEMKVASRMKMSPSEYSKWKNA